MVTQAEAVQAGNGGTEAGQSPLRVLIVDDDPLGRNMMGIMLAPLGYRLDFACDGSEALQAIETRSYAIVFMDLILPDMNGMDVSRQVREREAGQRHVPIIAVTAYDLPGQPLEMIKAGLDDYIFKPYDLRGLKRVIQLYTGTDHENELAGPEQRKSLSETPVLDYKSSLADLSGDSAGYHGLLRGFIASLPVRLEKMVNAEAAGDYVTLGRETHSLKGICAGLGAMRLSKLAAYTSYCCDNGPRERAGEALAAVKQGMAELRQEAEVYLASPPG